MQRQLAVGHALDEAGDGRLVVAGGERGGEPQAERPCRRQRRAPGQRGVFRQHFLGRGAVDQEVLKRLAGHAELRAGHFLAGDLERHQLGVVHEHAIAAIGQVEGNILVGLLAAGAAVLIPDIDGLAVLHKGGEALAQAVDVFAHTQRELLVHEVLALALDVAHAARLAGRQHAAVLVLEGHAPRAATRHPRRQPPAGERGRVFASRGAHIARGLPGDGKARPTRLPAREVRQPHADHIVHRCRQLDGEQRAFQRIAAVGDARGGGGDGQRVVGCFGIVGFGGVKRRDAGPQQPVAVGKFHSRVPLCAGAVGCGARAYSPAAALSIGAARPRALRQETAAGWSQFARAAGSADEKPVCSGRKAAGRAG